jgi:glutamine amidotransferase
MFESKEQDVVLGYAEYGDVTIPAIIAKNNIIGIQCHPEKSQAAGLQFLHDFLLWNPKAGM